MIGRKIKQTALFILAMSAWVLMGATGCSKSDEVGEVDATLRLTKTNVTAKEVSQFMKIESNTSWELSLSYPGEQQDWCDISADAIKGKGSKTVVLTYAPNKEWEERAAYIVISVRGEEYHRVMLTQAGDEDATAKLILANPNVLGTSVAQSLDVLCKDPWELSFDYGSGQSDWCSFAEADLSGAGDKRVTLNYTQNNGEKQRKVDIVLTVGTREVRTTLTQLGTEMTAKLTLTNPVVEYTDRAQILNVVSNGTWTLSFIFEDSETDWCSVAGGVMTGTGEQNVTLNYTQNDSANERKVRIKVVAGTTKDEVTLTQKAKAATPPPVMGWLELPATKDMANCRFVTHKTSVNSKAIRNFSMLYDMKEKLAYWVAYPHHKSFIGSSGRTNAWQYDPKFTQAEQVNLKKGISGYDRGHQIPSGDRTANRETNVQTFFYTNMTPQLGKLNQTIWASLEDIIRNKWLSTNNADTLYIVTGGILKTVGGNEAVKYVSDNDGTQMAVPNYYYKVLLHRTGGGTYKAIGFWFPHKAATTAEGYRKYAKSVRDIETLTGFDFFANLPKEIQEKVENELIFTDWKDL